MTIHQTNLWAALFWKTNQWRYRHKMHGRTQIFLADCGVRLPHWALITQGFRLVSIGWNHRKHIFGPVYDLATRRKTKRLGRENIQAGWGGGLCNAWAKEAGSRYERGAPGEHQDNHLFGVSDESWVRFKWGWRQARHTVRGWSMAAIVKWLTARKMQDQSPQDRWSVGCPEWYASHQP